MIGVVSPYFNFYGNPQRLENLKKHQTFLEKSGVAYVFVEFQLPDRDFDLEPGPNVLQYRTLNPKWHKTNGINIGAKHLINNRKCTSIAWIDADFVLDTMTWPDQAEEMLKTKDVIQLQAWIRYPEGKMLKSWLFSNFTGQDGGGWATKAELFEKVGFFDCVVSGANKAILSGINPAVWKYGYQAYWKRLDGYSEAIKPIISSYGVLPLLGTEYGHGDRGFRIRMARTRFEMLYDIHFDFDADCYYDDNGVIEFKDSEGFKALSIMNYVFEREHPRPAPSMNHPLRDIRPKHLRES